jgi:hypothetical protein
MEDSSNLDLKDALPLRPSYFQTRLSQRNNTALATRNKGEIKRNQTKLEGAANLVGMRGTSVTDQNIGSSKLGKGKLDCCVPTICFSHVHFQEDNILRVLGGETFAIFYVDIA